MQNPIAFDKYSNIYLVVKYLIFCQEFVAASNQNLSLNYLGVALELL